MTVMARRPASAYTTVPLTDGSREGGAGWGGRATCLPTNCANATLSQFAPAHCLVTWYLDDHPLEIPDIAIQGIGDGSLKINKVVGFKARLACPSLSPTRRSVIEEGRQGGPQRVGRTIPNCSVSQFRGKSLVCLANPSRRGA